MWCKYALLLLGNIDHILLAQILLHFAVDLLQFGVFFDRSWMDFMGREHLEAHFVYLEVQFQQ